MNQKRFRSRQSNFHRTPRQIGNQCSVVLNRHIFFSAKTASDETILYAHLIGSEKQTAFMEGTVRRLIGRNDHHITVFFHIRNGTFRLQERMLCPRRFKMMGNHMRCIRNCLPGISAAHIFMRLYVGFFLIKYTRCIRCCRLFDVMNCRENLILYLDQFFRFFNRFQIFCRYERNGIAKVMRQSTYRDQRILVMFDVTNFIFPRNIVRRKDTDDSRKCFCSCGIDGKHSCSWIFASKRRAVAHVFHIKVIRIFSVSQYFFFYIQSVHARSDFPVIRAFLWNVAVTHDFCSQLYSSNDFHIAGTTAIIVAQCIHNLILCGIGIFIQQRFRAHHHARNTETTLYGTCLSVSICIYL